MDIEKASGNSRSINIEQLVEIDQLYLNVSQQVIVTTADKVKLCLNRHVKRAEKKKEWITPFSLLLTIIGVLVTSTFKDIFLSADTWKAIFFLIGVASFVWLLITIKYAFREFDINYILNEIKLGEKITKTENDNTPGDNQ